MTMDSERDDLEALFAAARDADPVPGALRTRVLADAAQVQEAFSQPVPRPAPRLWPQIRAALGGWAGLGGLATACAAGVWLGFAPPGNWIDPILLMQDQAGFDLFQGEDVIAFLDLEEG